MEQMYVETVKCVCFQSVSGSEEQGGRVWLAVHEDGISVLEHNLMVKMWSDWTLVLMTIC